MTVVLNSVCDGHEHDAGLPSLEVRLHILQLVGRYAERVMADHGLDVERTLELLHVALEDVADEDAFERDQVH